MTASVTWPQALAWRMKRHFLDPIGDPSIEDVVRRLCGIQAQVASSAELAVRGRRTASVAGEVGAALADGRLIKTWAMRGTLHLLRAEDAGMFLALMATGRSWERKSWQTYFGLSPDTIPRLRAVAHEALDGRVLTREELIDAVIARPELEYVGKQMRSGWGTLLKPLAWNGELVFGPSRGNRVTFMRPEAASTRWVGLPDPDTAAALAIPAYLAAYGPATGASFANWLAAGWFGQRQLRAWFDALGDRLAKVDLEGEPAYVRSEDLDDLGATTPTRAVRLLGGFDQYVLGPTTADGRVTPAARRRAVSKTAGWISPVVLYGGVVSGTWELDGDRLAVMWFAEAGRPPTRQLAAEAERLGPILARRLTLDVAIG